MRILLVEDNQRFGKILTECLTGEGYSVDYVKTAEDFQQQSMSSRYNIYLVDLCLPDGDGIDLIKELRRASDSTPIIVLTGRSFVSDRVKGLDCGADDYLVKPFNHLEVLARIRALVRRPAKLLPQQLQAGKLVLDCKTGELYCDGRRMDLGPCEQRMLALLIRHLGQLVQREHIEHVVYGMSTVRSPNATDKMVSRLRGNLKDVNVGIELRTIKGAGYILEEVRCH